MLSSHFLNCLSNGYLIELLCCTVYNPLVWLCLVNGVSLISHRCADTALPGVFLPCCSDRLTWGPLAFSCCISGFDSDSAFGEEVNSSSSWALAFWAEFRKRDWDMLMWHLCECEICRPRLQHTEAKGALRDPIIVTAIDLCERVSIWPFRAFPHRKVWERKRQIDLESLYPLNINVISID